MDNRRLCPDCGQDLTYDAFYKRADGTPNTYCKECQKTRTRNNPNRFKDTKTVSLNEGERLVLAELWARGVPALPAKALSRTFGDLIAYGCVTIEVKHSVFNGSRYQFNTSPRQRKTGFCGQIVVLVLSNNDGNSFHLFRANSNYFRNEDGTMKKGFEYAPGRTRQRLENSLTDSVMETQRDGWQLIESEVGRIQAALIDGATMDSFFAA